MQSAKGFIVGTHLYFTRHRIPLTTVYKLSFVTRANTSDILFHELLF